MKRILYIMLALLLLACAPHIIMQLFTGKHKSSIIHDFLAMLILERGNNSEITFGSIVEGVVVTSTLTLSTLMWIYGLVNIAASTKDHFATAVAYLTLLQFTVVIAIQMVAVFRDLRKLLKMRAQGIKYV